ncbi:MAG: RcnB family protein [Steroidobacteraceae bacterium]
MKRTVSITALAAAALAAGTVSLAAPQGRFEREGLADRGERAAERREQPPDVRGRDEHRDAAPRDGGARTVEPRDAGPRDAGPRDSRARDGGSRDAGPRGGAPPVVIVPAPAPRAAPPSVAPSYDPGRRDGGSRRDDGSARRGRDDERGSRGRGDERQDRNRDVESAWRDRGDDRRDRSGYERHEWRDDRDGRSDRGWRDDRGREWRYDRGWYDRYRADRWRYDRGRYYARQRFSIGIYYMPRGYGSRLWLRGDWLPLAYWDGPRYRLYDFWRYDLYDPPYRAGWVRVGTDALLIDFRSGEVLDVVYELFW